MRCLLTTAWLVLATHAALAQGQGAIQGQPIEAPDRKVVGTDIRVYTPGPLPTREPRRPPTLAVLQQRMPELAFDQAPLQGVLEQLAELAGTTIAVQWRELESAGVAPDTPISLHVRGLPLRTVLWLVLRQAATDTELAYEARESLILVSTREFYDKQLVVRIYDVTELVALDPVYPAFDFGQVRSYVEGLEPVVGSSVGLVRPIVGQIRSGVRAGDPRDPNGLNPDTPRNPGDERVRQKMEELIRVIQSTIQPEHWEPSGGPGSIRPFRYKLVINASPLVHQMIGGARGEE